MGHRAIEITKAAIVRLAQLNELYKNSEKNEKDKIRNAIWSLVYQELREEFYAFLYLKSLDDTLSGIFDTMYVIQKETDEKRADFILRGAVDKYNPSYTDEEIEEDEAPF